MSENPDYCTLLLYLRRAKLQLAKLLLRAPGTSFRDGWVFAELPFVCRSSDCSWTKDAVPISERSGSCRVEWNDEILVVWYNKPWTVSETTAETPR